ncbi:leucine-rich repeat and immunoglobulin-like domain-containing nogo receptor-interacting protein 4b [Betta splendens]|uniref:leucine-rich repeat and immunoglobulin-like domain-containing nogo receptor-interacting protein 4b n=1 Tax=Betta splendens TaxID=158456 RepID=UPI0010F7A742|nr:leucine-rich repeat and immunoglobulin-like domain-containing nogo receptor-interacting protein 4b [Betta splendens]XP_028983904.1 leucine-rich repeat and immunoglobulin-like domain-containing nogo receptor-interacting protein 4b [Betta splendens]XP_028983905.1 leucine-rich repeat and immunoglobulin-like domain-containing nogo receptor-interacting protein 4b [Betta splendens]
MYVEPVVRWAAWILLLQFGLGASAGSCPPRCVCRPDSKEVICSGKHLNSVPDGFASDAKRLDLSHNKIKSVGRRQFAGLQQLQELDLSDNVISMMEVEAFQGLQNLRTLCIKNNRLKIIPVGVFSGLSSLRLLDLSQNEILVFLDYTFKEMVNLQTLEAGENDLVFISQRAFFGLQNLQELNLERSNLTSMPTEALSQLQSLTRLQILRLTISSLPNNAFRRLHRLRSLLIAHWPSLDTVASNSLIGLNLTSLVISNCNLSVIPYSALRHLVYLRFLDLSYNPITVIQGNLLGDLLRLQELHLAGGNLLRIEPGAFRGLAYFRMLNVTSNQLTTLEESVFHSVGNLQVLRLDGNPLACDCRLLWVVRRRLRLNFDGHQPTCSSPDAVRQREFRDFTEKELPRLFTCRPARIMDRRPQEARVEEGTNVLFSCKADGDPFPSITWISSHKNVVSPTGRIRVLSNGTLEVRYAQVQDSGTYQCLAGNAAGNDSLTVGLYVKGLPRNRTIPFFSEEGWVEPSNTQAANSSAQVAKPYPFDAKTLIIATTMGFLSFLSSVAICFVFMFFWSQSKGQIKHTATIDFVPRSSMGGGGGDGAEGGRFTMKLI